jgi:hypothetical protein
MSSAIARNNREILNWPVVGSLLFEPSESSNAMISELRDTIRGIVRDLTRSRTLGESYSAILEQLDNLELDCSLPNWDGEDAAPVSGEAVVRAREFVEALPRDLPQPEITAGRDGEVLFDWIKDQKRMVTAYVTTSGLIRFVYINNQENDFGAFVFAGRVDPRLTIFILKLSE